MRALRPAMASQEHLPLLPELTEPPRLLPLVLAVGVHLLVLLVAWFSPYLFHQRRKVPEVYTVNLFNVQDIGIARQMAPPQPKAAAPPEVKKVEEKAPPKVEAAPAPPPPAPAKAISTQPLPEKSRADLERVKKLKESINTAEKAREAEKVAQDRAREAVEALRKSLQSQTGKAAPPTPSPAVTTGVAQKGSPNAVAGGQGGSVEVNEAFKRYLLAVYTQVQEHWKLPESQPWKETLEAIIVIKVRRDGTVSDTFFEHRSENLVFNQHVERAIRQAAPLPPFPAGFDQKDMELGLRFRPGRVF